MAANRKTVDLIRNTGSLTVAEIGVGEGDTSLAIAQALNHNGELHLFDFDRVLDNVRGRLEQAGFSNVKCFGCSEKTRDSYNWPLAKLIETNTAPIYDYVYLDGSHSWAIDALAFFLIDRLLKVGGYIDFDDYEWTFIDSPTVNPEIYPPAADWHTTEQLGTPQVKMIIDLLVRRSENYVEAVENKVFQKTGRENQPRRHDYFRAAARFFTNRLSPGSGATARRI